MEMNNLFYIHCTFRFLFCCVPSRVRDQCQDIFLTPEKSPVDFFSVGLEMAHESSVLILNVIYVLYLVYANLF